MSEIEEDIEYYGDQYIASKDAKIPSWLKWVYLILPFWGVLWMFFYWNGSFGWVDRGYWNQLERAANTTFPHHDQDPLVQNKPSQNKK